MTGWIRVSRVAATLLLAFMIWNEFATDSLLGNLQAEAAGAPAQHLVGSSRGARPSSTGPDVLVAPPRPAPSPTATVSPTATPAPTVTPTLTTKSLGVFTVTGYSDSPLRNGTDGRGITKSGERTRWGVVAVDPKVIPLGSHLRIDGLGDTVFTALDTGFGVQGRWVDVWYGTDGEALHHGVKQLTVHLVEDR